MADLTEYKTDVLGSVCLDGDVDPARKSDRMIPLSNSSHEHEETNTKYNLKLQIRSQKLL